VSGWSASRPGKQLPVPSGHEAQRSLKPVWTLLRRENSRGIFQESNPRLSISATQLSLPAISKGNPWPRTGLMIEFTLRTVISFRTLHNSFQDWDYMSRMLGWIKNCYWFGRARSWPNRGSIPSFSCRGWGKPWRTSVGIGGAQVRPGTAHKSREFPLDQPVQEIV
jgi:hypothetical protein